MSPNPVIPDPVRERGAVISAMAERGWSPSILEATTFLVTRGDAGRGFSSLGRVEYGGLTFLPKEGLLFFHEDHVRPLFTAATPKLRKPRPGLGGYPSPEVMALPRWVRVWAAMTHFSGLIRKMGWERAWEKTFLASHSGPPSDPWGEVNCAYGGHPGFVIHLVYGREPSQIWRDSAPNTRRSYLSNGTQSRFCLP